MGETSPVLVLIDLNTKQIVSAINYDKIGPIIRRKDGVRGISYGGDTIYFATWENIFKTGIDFSFIEKLEPTGKDLHQLEYVPELGLLYCSTGENVVKLWNEKKTYTIFHGFFFHNHINSLYFTEKKLYVLTHNGADYGAVLTNHGEVLVRNLWHPHNIYINKEQEIIVCDSRKEKISKYRDGIEIKSFQTEGFTKGLAISKDKILFGIAVREAGKSYIGILNHDFQLLEQIKFTDIDERLIGHPYDIRIWSEIDYGMSQNFGRIKA